MWAFKTHGFSGDSGGLFLGLERLMTSFPGHELDGNQFDPMPPDTQHISTTNYTPVTSLKLVTDPRMPFCSPP